jgi:hypothetical protein
MLSLSNDQRPTIHAAAEDGDLAAVNLYIAEGVNLNAKNELGHTPLSLAARSNQLKVGKSALSCAVFMGNAKVAQALLEAGADVNIIDNLGQTPLIYAVSSNYPYIVQLLVDAGARIGTLDGVTGGTAADLAVSLGHHSIVQILLKAGARIGEISV